MVAEFCLACLCFGVQMKVEEPQLLQLPAAAQHSTAAMQPAFAALLPGANSSSSSRH